MNRQQTTPDPWISAHADLVPTGSLVLDMACGSGRHSRLFLERGNHVMAVDRNVAAFDEHPEDPALSVLQYDLEADPWPFPPQFFDAIVVCNYLHRPLFTPLFASLKPPGILLYTTFMQGNEAYGRPSNPDFLLQPDELNTLLPDDAEIIEFVQGPVGEPVTAVRQSIAARMRLN